MSTFFRWRSTADNSAATTLRPGLNKEEILIRATPNVGLMMFGRVHVHEKCFINSKLQDFKLIFNQIILQTFCSKILHLFEKTGIFWKSNEKHISNLFKLVYIFSISLFVRDYAVVGRWQPIIRRLSHLRFSRLMTGRFLMSPRYW